MIKFIKWVFNFREPKRQLLHIILVTFLFSFFMARAYSLFITHSIYIRGYHIHHFYYGMLFLSIGGVLGILSRKRRSLQFASILIGAGIGLFADEIGLLLNCTTEARVCAYAFPNVIDIVATITLAILLIIILTGLFDRFFHLKSGKNIPGAS